jgi:glycine hydroxymethyltransferase
MTASSIYFQSLPYGITSDSNLVDYDKLAAQAKLFKPRLIICGASAYPRDWNYASLRQIADKEGAYLMADIAHTSGLVAAQELGSPFEYCDVVTTTTYVADYTRVPVVDLSLVTRLSVVPELV